MNFKPVSSQVKFPQLEEEMLSFWQEQGVFEKSLGQRQGNEEFVFYDDNRLIVGGDISGAGSDNITTPKGSHQTGQDPYRERAVRGGGYQSCQSAYLEML